MISAFGLMGNQTHVGLGAEWLIIAAGTGTIYVNGYLQALKQGGSIWSLYRERLVVGTTNYMAQMTGACLLLLGIELASTSPRSPDRILPLCDLWRMAPDRSRSPRKDQRRGTRELSQKWPATALISVVGAPIQVIDNPARARP